MLIGPNWLGRVRGDEAAIVLGDFNCVPGSPPHRLLAAALRDARSFLTPPPSLRSFPTLRPLLAVDHIFVNPALEVEAVETVQSVEARLASDHFPVRARIQPAA